MLPRSLPARGAALSATAIFPTGCSAEGVEGRAEAVTGVEEGSVLRTGRGRAGRGPWPVAGGDGGVRPPARVLEALECTW